MELYRISGLAASALLLTAPLCIASAADMPLKAPPAAPPPVYSWTGFYVGGNAGVGWNRGNTDVNPLPNAATFVNLLQQTLNTNPRGAFAGGQIGANWQIGSVVVGAEFDWQGANVQGTVTQTPIIQNNGTPFPGAGFININQKIDSFGTARLRVGTTIVNPQLLLYVTGGFAFAHISDNAVTNFQPVGTTIYAGNVSTNRDSSAIGGGLEWAFDKNWSLKAEYLHMNFGSSSVTVNPQIPLPPFQVNYNFHTQLDVARIGVNYMFGAGH